MWQRNIMQHTTDKRTPNKWMSSSTGRRLSVSFFFFFLVVLGENYRLSLTDLFLTFRPFWMHVCTCACRKPKRTSPSFHPQQNVLLPLPLFPAAIALLPQAPLVAPGEHHHLEQPSKRSTSLILLTHLTPSSPSGYPNTFLCLLIGCISSRQSPRNRPPSPSGVKQRPPSPQPASKPPPIQKPALTPTGPPILRKRESKPKDASPMTALTSQPQDTSTASPAPSTKPKDGENYLFTFIYFNQYRIIAVLTKPSPWNRQRFSFSLA